MLKIAKNQRKSLVSVLALTGAIATLAVGTTRSAVSITAQDAPTGTPEPSAVVGLVAMGALFAGSAKKRFERK